jgi:tetratricopeptide (TPR) repeat protein
MFRNCGLVIWPETKRLKSVVLRTAPCRVAAPLRFNLLMLIGLVLCVMNSAWADSKPDACGSATCIEGVVRDSAGLPVAGASVRLDSEKNENGASTDASGHFRLEANSLGKHTLKIQKTGFADFVQAINLDGVQSSLLNVVLARATQAARAAPDMQFSQDTDFTVAGVTDWTAAGGHGSDVNLRTSEALARETRTLSSGVNEEPTPSKPETLRKQREELRNALAHSDRADLHRLLGDINEQLNDPLGAVHEYERAAQLDPSEANYFAWATELLVHRAIQPALEVFSKGARAFPSSERLQVGLGAALYASGLYAQAAEHVCAASDIALRDQTPYLLLGRMVQALAQPLPCAVEAFARFQHAEPENASADYYYALALWKQADRLQRAETAQQTESLLKEAVRIQPQFADAYLQLGILYAARGEPGKAITAYQQAIAASADCAEAHFRLAQAYRLAGEQSRARQELQTYEQIQKSQAAAVERQRREIQQFVVVFKDKDQSSPTAKQ